MAIRQQRPRYSFLKDESAPQLKYSLAISGFSFICLAVLVVISGVQAGEVGPAAGAVGLAAMLTAWYAFWISLRELIRRPRSIRLAVISTAFSGILAIVWLALFLAGVKAS